MLLFFDANALEYSLRKPDGGLFRLTALCLKTRP